VGPCPSESPVANLLTNFQEKGFVYGYTVRPFLNFKFPTKNF
jgi:hypothetical protein